ncbi:MAG: 30S ribosome-binding factor RbfA [Alphaproteobacteria bacterium]|jgi:ribosome-binding factor A|uniref:30S ribosome-binding factor RbfA n=1 Tax=Maricaulis alexandrii TaxID=2570354 RepID=UPI00110854E7|nr:30S ribosome-binding factor RbfA [Maricaulis alexandrii]MCR9265978.1 30S ribosome-binding factor RbfA [Alphaproteobacteria bacterium]
MARRQKSASAKGPSQRQLRAGELLRHALVDILAREEMRDPDLEGVLISVTEVRPSPDLRQAKVYVAPLGHGDQVKVAAALNRASSFLRGRLGREIDMKFTPELHFHPDNSFDTASHVDELLRRPQVQRDLDHGEDED